MTRAATPTPRPFDPWEMAIIGADEILLDPVVVPRAPSQAARRESPPVLEAVAVMPPEVQQPPQRVQAPAPAEERPQKPPTPVYEQIPEQRAPAPHPSAIPGNAVPPSRRPRGRWRKLVIAVLALPVLGFVGLVWLGKQASPNPQIVADAQELPPSFEAPIKLPPKVPPVAEHRPDQLDKAASGVAPADILAQAGSEDGAPVAPAGKTADPGIPSTSAPPAAAPVLPPATLVPRTVGAVAEPTPAAKQPTPTPKKSTTRVLPPASGASGPAGLFAIGTPSARAASAPGKSDPKPEAASEAAVQPIAAPKVTATGPLPTLPDSSGIRRAVYGRSGIVALTSNSVIVYDRERRIQTEVLAGGTLPDGSKVLSVQPNRHRIETDHGTLELSAPNSN